jgi:glutaredoxin
VRWRRRRAADAAAAADDRSRRTPPRSVTVYTRAGCHLCREAERIVAEVAHGVTAVEIVDIDADPALTERYTVRVPVVAIDGEERFELQVDPDELRAALRG